MVTMTLLYRDQEQKVSSSATMLCIEYRTERR
jgi:hypothetical protein